MTTESAPAPRTAEVTGVRATATAIHPPRTGAGRGPAVRAGRSGRRWGPAGRLVAADAVAVCLTPVALGLAPVVVDPLPWPSTVFALQAGVQLLLHAYRGLYRTGLSPSVLGELPALLGLALVQWYAIAELLTAYGPGHAIGWTVLGCAVAVQTLLSCAARAWVYRSRSRAYARNPRSVLVVGEGPFARQVIAVLQDHPEYGMRPVGRVVPGSAPAGERTAAAGTDEAAPLPVLATPEDVSRAVIQNTVRHAVFTTAPESVPGGAALFGLFAGHGCGMWLIHDPAGAAVSRGRAMRSDHLWGFAARALHPGGSRHPLAHTAKRAMDAVLAAFALLVAAPLMAACALAVRLSDGPGVVFRQERVGRHGRPFVLLKFRTLRPADPQESATRWNVASDRRMSRVGKALRRSSLDELPQLWNVLRGDMSLVGPRPERPYFVQQFSRLHPGYQARHRMPVGITGLAQVHGLRGDTSIEERTRFDNRYIDTWSLWQDVCVLARTAGSLFRFGGS